MKKQLEILVPPKYFLDIIYSPLEHKSKSELLIMKNIEQG